MPITPNQRSVLEKLAAQDEPLHGRDFADIATVQHGRWEWAGPILKGLAAKGLVQRGEVKTWKGHDWSITPTGRAALGAGAAEPKGRSSQTPLSEGMKAELVWIGNCEAKGEEVEACGRRTTHESLERRGLIRILSRDRGWRTLELTPAGKDIYKSLTAKTAGRG